ncbi:hypothetical protein ABZP36_013596 [Zizania latifolia]
MAPSFSIREYAASMRGTAASRHPLLGAGGFPPMPARRFRWWADELIIHTTARSPAARKKRPVSDLFAAAAATTDDVETDEASRVTKKKMTAAAIDNQRKNPRPQEAEDGDQIFSSSTPKASKVAINKLHPLDSAQTSQTQERHKYINIENIKMYGFEIWKPKDFRKHQQKSTRLTNSATVHPERSILKKHTKHSSISVRVNKSGRHVTFSGVDDILIIDKLSYKLPQLRSHCNVHSDVVAKSSPSMNSSNQAEKFVAANAGSHKNKDVSYSDLHDRGNSESSGAQRNLIDLNRAFISDSEVPDFEHTMDATCDLQILGDGREAVLKHSQGLHFKSQRVQCEIKNYDKGRIINSGSAAASLLSQEATNISDRRMFGLPLNSRGEIIKFYERNSTRDGHMKGKFSCYPCQNQLHAEKPRLHSDINVQHERAVISQHTVRLMGKDLTVSTTRGKCIHETAKDHVDSSIRCHHSTNIFLELPHQGHPFLSLQSQHFSSIQVDAASTSHDYVGYRMHHLRHRFPEADVFSGNGIECGDRLRSFSYLPGGRNVPSRFPPLQGNCNTRPHQTSLAHWCSSDPLDKPEQSVTPVFPTVMPHAKRSSVDHANSTWSCDPYSANLLAHHPDGANFIKQPNQTIGEVAEIPSDADKCVKRYC